MYDMCKNNKLHMVTLETNDGKYVEGIVDEYDKEGVTLIMPSGDMENQERVWFGGGFGGPGYGPGFGPGYGAGFGYGRYPRRFRRFRRQRFPFFGLRRFFFPFFY
ncbi:hypothetical protein CEY16_11205 [Halalkalibacillus sediminis]|uniref:Uncharacterized protein n=2 Tax=Halalkalibacillus sediminis TaxID=2018042 RepID=A0A2I0QT70_9BACI|nr:hypothetical protein CEY16_11205 [Halalkalibacillus sediminis]